VGEDLNSLLFLIFVPVLPDQVQAIVCRANRCRTPIGWYLYIAHPRTSRLLS
jgi:hypothetical protein